MKSLKSSLQIFFALIGLAVFALLAFLFIGIAKKSTATTYGVTWSGRYAWELGLDPDKALATALDDIGIRRFRIPAYWGLLESTPDKWDFASLDRDVAAIGKRNGKIILAIGEKLPRWPECWGPDWWKKLSRDKQRPRTLAYLEKVVTRYRDNKTITAWQVENEPHFSYGDCPAADPDFLQQEISLVRKLDPTRPVYTTDSGELSLWMTFGKMVDALGVSTYRVVRNPWLDDWNFTYWWVPPFFYERKALLARLFGVKKIYVSEFQMEPWSNTTLQATPIENQLTSMNLTQMKANFSFAERMGVPAVDFWGVEWWIWMKEKQNHPEFVNEAKKFWAGQTP